MKKIGLVGEKIWGQKIGVKNPGPRLRHMDKGDKEVIKFCHLWQASDKAEFCHCYVDT